MTETTIATAVALTIGIVWAVRQTGIVPDRFVPLISLVFGVMWANLLGASGADMALNGVMVGLMASGAWSGGKTLLLG